MYARAYNKRHFFEPSYDQALDMRRILLTQSQASTFVSSGVVLTFTLLLFLAGYVLQQRTVTGLQQALKPRIPQIPPSLLEQQQQYLGADLQPSRLFQNRREGHVVYADPSEARSAAAGSINWKRLAHIQLVKEHRDLCSAIMVLAEFHRMKSPARRLLLFPQAWAAEKSDDSDPSIASSRRLMRMAARRYGVELRPILPIAQDALGDVYSLTSAYALKDLDRVLTIETPGLLMDASPMDAVLAFTENAPFAMLNDETHGDGVHSEDLFLIQPSRETYVELTKEFASDPNFNDTLLSKAFPDQLLLESNTEDSALIRSIGTLHDVSDDFNATAYVSDVAYIRFSDPKLPGPEYDVPWTEKRDARPKNKDADWIWTKLYGQFTQKRMETCGLDLDHWRP